MHLRIPILLSLIVGCFCFGATGQVKSPEAFLGYQLGDQFTRHHQVVSYFQHVADQSSSVLLQQYGETYEKRPLYLAFISTEENLKKLDQIRQDNLKRAGMLEGAPQSDVVIVWLSYNVHGNESVSTEAAMATLYELVKPGSDKADWLKNTVVVIDPCVNPDGRERYVNFYWEHVNSPYNPNPDSWEHHELWPGGRANHYLFDLNRDWAWMTQAETQQRMAQYNRWLPQVHVDFHEQGVDNPYYFAPAAEPFHELITDWQRDFQIQIGKNHAKYFDQNNWLYFTKQVFDLLYPSYGDTYPIYNGAIGMTYEQGGSGRAGLGVIKQEGDTLTLRDRIAHHYTTGLSTVEMAAKNADRLLKEYDQFFHKRANAKYKSYVLKYDGDADKFADLKTWLDQLGIRYGTTAAKSLSGYQFGSGKSASFKVASEDLVVSIDQPKSVLASVLFEPETWLADSLTYDITAWGVPYAFGIEAYGLTSTLPVTSAKSAVVTAQPSVEEAYGYLFVWKNLKDAQLLAALLKEGVQVRYTTRPVTVADKTFGRGSFMVMKRDNKRGDLPQLIEKLAGTYGREVYPMATGFVTDGPDMGSGDIHYLKPPKVALIGGEGTSSLDFGAAWHFFEQSLGYPVTVLSTEYFGRVDLDQYDVLIMPDGWYGELGERTLTAISDWVAKGGTLLALQGAIRKLPENLAPNKFNSDDEKSTFERLDASVSEEMKLIPSAEQERYQIREYVAGAIFEVHLDNTHPLAYGYPDRYYSLKTAADRYAYLDEGNVGVIQSAADYRSGFAGQLVKKKVGESMVFGVKNQGRGHVVYMVDDPLFRSFWYNGKLLFANAIFYITNE